MGNQYDEMIQWEEENKGWDDPTNYPLPPIPPQQPWPKIVNRPKPKKLEWVKYHYGEPLKVGDVVKFHGSNRKVKITHEKSDDKNKPYYHGQYMANGVTTMFPAGHVEFIQSPPF